MRYWLDTEFIEDGVTIDLISIGIVCEDGREYYAINWDCDLEKANDWVKENVISQLPDREHPAWNSKEDIKFEILKFVCWHSKDPHFEPGCEPEFWGYYADYDWVVFCQLFGTMMDLPKGFSMYCMDLKQWCKQLGDPKLPEQGKGEHNAIADARWNKQAWEFLKQYERL